MRSEAAARTAASGAADSRLAEAESARTAAEAALQAARAELGAAVAAAESERAARERSEAAARELGGQLQDAAARQAALALRVTELEKARTAGDSDLARQLTQATQERDRLAQSLAAAEARAQDAATWRLEAESRAAEAVAVRKELAAAKERLEARGAARLPVPEVAPAEPLVVAAALPEETRAPGDTPFRERAPGAQGPESALVTVAEPIASPAAPAPVDFRETETRDDKAAAIAAVRRWAEAWSRQDVDGYLASYAASFQPPDGLRRGEWMEQRRLRLRRPSFIEIGVSEVELRVLTPDRLAVRFQQDYRSDTFADRVLKTLELTRADGEWKIVRERAE